MAKSLHDTIDTILDNWDNKLYDFIFILLYRLCRNIFFNNQKYIQLYTIYVPVCTSNVETIIKIYSN